MTRRIILPYIKNICKRDPLSGKVVTGGIVTVKGFLVAPELDYQPSASVPRTSLRISALSGSTALFSDKPGDYVKKPMRDCTGKEICMEWLYHIGVPER